MQKPWITFIKHFKKPIVYRNLKPSNVIITKSGDPILVDFGIARYYSPEKNTDTFCYGTPGYAAPEQYKGRGQSAPQSDLFSLGVMLFQMLTKYDPIIKPFHFPAIKTLNTDVSPALEAIILKAIQLDPDKRYKTIGEFKKALEKYSGMSATYSGPKEKNKWAETGKTLAWCTILLPIIFFSLAATMRCEIFIALATLSIFICPLAGLTISIIGRVKAAKDKSITPALTVEAIGCNLVVLAVISFFVGGLIIPNMMRSRYQGLHFACESNLKNIATALEMYATDNEGKYPPSLRLLVENSDYQYIKKIPVCPSSHSSYGYEVSQDSYNFTLWCGKERSHSKTYPYNKNGCWPQYTPGEGIILKPH